MKMQKDLETAFNGHVSMELASSMAYLQMSAYFAERNLTGMSRWMRNQAEEERDHALRFLDFVLDRGNSVRIEDISAPAGDFTGPEHVFATALEQEQAVTLAIHDLYRLATDLGDLAAFPFLQAFIAEQNEEEAMVESILDRLQLAGDDSSALLILDHELGQRKTPS